jgi:hypothetical protein
MKQNQFDLGIRIQQLFFLSIIFGVLWVKEYLWCAFLLAGLLYFWESLLAAAFRAALSSPTQPIPRKRTKPQRQTLPPSIARTSEDEEAPPTSSGDDFREPPPSRSAPKKR